MQKLLSTALLMFGFVCLAERNEAAVNLVPNINAQGHLTLIQSENTLKVSSVIEVIMGANGNATMIWDAFGGPGPYSVTVRDLSTLKTIAAFATTNTSANISGLINGHTCRFEVKKASDTIILDLVISQ